MKLRCRKKVANSTMQINGRRSLGQELDGVGQREAHIWDMNGDELPLTPWPT